MQPTALRVRSVLAVALTSLLALPTLAQDTRVSTDLEREVLVMFRPGAVTAHAGRDAGPLNAFDIAALTLREALSASRVETIARVIPGFRAEDRFYTTASGEHVELTDWSRILLLRVPSAQEREPLIEALQALPEVVYAEPNYRGEPDLFARYTPLAEPLIPSLASATLLSPNDEFFYRQWGWLNDGSVSQGSGTPDADVDATEAWDITTGSSNINIGIVDNGMQTGHLDFGGRVSGDIGDNSGHGTAVTGIAAAVGNNTRGVAGMAWAGGIINEDYGASPSAADLAAAVRSASTRGAHVINNSWKCVEPETDILCPWSYTLRLAFKDVYLQNRVAVVSQGNRGTIDNAVQYPAAFGQGILSVGATTNTDVRADYSTEGPWIDVSAPGGGGFGAATETTDYWYTTVPGGSYDFRLSDGSGIAGTSFSAPVVSGLAALLLAVNPGLENDDVEQIIRLGVDDVNAATYPGFDNYLGTGRVNARKALDLVRAPYTFTRSTATGGTDQGASSYETMQIIGASGLADGTYTVRRHEVRKTVYYAARNNVNVWGRHAGALGWSRENPNVALNYTEVIPGTVTSTSAQVRTYVYEIFDIYGRFIGWQPTTPQNTTFAYTVHGTLPFTASISGPTALNEGDQGTWTASASGGNGSYAYRWYYSVLDDLWIDTGVTTQSYTRTAANYSFTLKARVTSGAETAEPTRHVTVTPDGPGGPPCKPPGPCPSPPALAAGEASGTAAVASSQASAQAIAAPASFALEAATPNPFRATTMLRFSLAETAEVRLVVYDALGREVARPVDGRQEAGPHAVAFDGSALPAGVYVVRLVADGASGLEVATARMTLLR